MSDVPELDPAQRRASRRIVAAQTASKLGDVLVDAKTVLTWLMTSVGAPVALIGALVPIRESGSMLPQLWLTEGVQRFGRRKWAYFAGAVGQALACMAMALAFVLPSGIRAGLAILVALGALALARALSSIASKDVLGRTVPKGARGRVGGLSSAISGVLGAGGSLAAIFWMRGDGEAATYAAVVAMAAGAFLTAGLAYATVAEPYHEPKPSPGGSTARLRMLWDDRLLRRFVIVRALLLGSALGGPFFVLFGQQSSDRLSTLATFVLAAGAAKALSSPWWGTQADRSGSRAMAWGGALAGLTAVVAVAVRQGLEGHVTPSYLWPALYFVFTVGYVGVRVGRKTHVVDMAGGDRRTAYVAASNTAIAIVLLAFGGLGAVLQAWSDLAALGLMGSLTLVGAGLALRLPGTGD
ncbi:MAG: MFS transporter [Myxococcota bacterium]